MTQAYSLDHPGVKLNRLEKEVTPLVDKEVDFRFHSARFVTKSVEPTGERLFPVGPWIRGVVRHKRNDLVLEYGDGETFKLTNQGDRYLFVKVDSNRKARYGPDTIIQGALQICPI